MARQPNSENRLKQRLVGAVVLVSLAVIFIPMLLSGRGGYERLITSSNIPPEPEPGRRVIEIPLQEIPPRPERKPVTTVVVDEYTKELPENFKPSKTGVEETGDTVSTDSAGETKSPPPRTAPPSPPPKERAPAAAEKAPPVKPEKDSGEPQAWVVQMGSFSERANAMALRDRIRGKKYPAYVEAVATPQGTIYRVRVGPERTRAKAEALQARLRKVFNLNGMVFPHREKGR